MPREYQRKQGVSSQESGEERERKENFFSQEIPLSDEQRKKMERVRSQRLTIIPQSMQVELIHE